ncbi:uncharacterized protein LOC141601373 [Silene latifolia]|uniref:uncharacterized protein LOC141601373 n=1 Tax=Silene latifolia TaxID=37657 RepID=UPI003D7737D8
MNSTKRCWIRLCHNHFKRNQANVQRNRKSGGDEKGKAPPTHAMGRMNAVQLMEKMAGPDMNLPTALEMLKRTKQNKQGVWLTPKAGTLFTDITNKKAELKSEVVTDIDENAIYYEVHKGYNKKGGFYGLGSAAEDYFERPTPSTTTPAGNHYSPGLYSRMASENKRLSAKLDDTTERLDNIEEFLTQHFGCNVTQNCNPGNSSQRREDDLDGNGHGDNTTPTPFTPWSSTNVVN